MGMIFGMFFGTDGRCWVVFWVVFWVVIFRRQKRGYEGESVFFGRRLIDGYRWLKVVKGGILRVP